MDRSRVRAFERSILAVKRLKPGDREWIDVQEGGLNEKCFVADGITDDIAVLNECLRCDSLMGNTGLFVGLLIVRTEAVIV